LGHTHHNWVDSCFVMNSQVNKDILHTIKSNTCFDLVRKHWKEKHVFKKKKSK
jgi:hypothetical protein